jgi:hypothetical protein
MTVRDMPTALQTLPRDAELLAFEPGCQDYCEREVDELELQGGRVYLHFVEVLAVIDHEADQDEDDDEAIED